jgi:hypothetical protein
MLLWAMDFSHSCPWNFLMVRVFIVGEVMHQTVTAHKPAAAVHITIMISQLSTSRCGSAAQQPSWQATLLAGNPLGRQPANMLADTRRY